MFRGQLPPELVEDLVSRYAQVAHHLRRTPDPFDEHAAMLAAYWMGLERYEGLPELRVELVLAGLLQSPDRADAKAIAASIERTTSRLAAELFLEISVPNARGRKVWLPWRSRRGSKKPKGRRAGP